MSKGENIFKRKDGRWEARYKKGYDETHKIIYGYCYGRTYREAKENVAAKKAALLLKTDQPASMYAKERFSVFCDTWVKCHADSWKLSTAAKYRSAIENHIKPSLGNFYISEICPNQVDLFTYHLFHEKNLAVKTVRDILTLLHKILTDLNLRTNDIFIPFQIIYPKTEPAELRVLTRKEQRQLIDYLNQDMDIYKFSVLLALTSGLRIGEICGLRWKDISLETRTVTVKHTVQRIKNPDSNASSKTIVQLGPPKTHSSRRIVPLTESIIPLCRQFQSELADAFVLTGTAQYIEPRILQRKLKKYTTALNLENVHFHTLRHTFATRCIEVGCDIKTLSEILGHSSISMTMNRYVHPSLDLKRENIKKLEQAGFGCAVN